MARNKLTGITIICVIPVIVLMALVICPPQVALLDYVAETHSNGAELWIADFAATETLPLGFGS